MILAIDPGNVESAYVYIDFDTYRPVEFGKVPNEELLTELKAGFYGTVSTVVIEMIQSYGMPVGATVFDTCIWIGRFEEAVEENWEAKVRFIKRGDVKKNICHATAAKDSYVIQALIDRFAPDTPNRGKGYKKDPGFFYGFRADIWQAYALGVTYIDKYNERMEQVRLHRQHLK